MSNRTFVVTGGNTGIGQAMATALARLAAHVAIVSRDRGKGEQALAEIQAASANPAVELVVGDLGTIAGTRQLGTTLLDRFPNLAVLINNAGVWPTRRMLNPDGLEIAFMVNHLAPFILSNLLLERLTANAPARIVNINAGVYVRGKLDLAKTPYGHDFSRFGTYANTKLANVLFTCELARRIEGSGVTVNAIHPGVIRTNLGDTSGLMGLILRFVKRNWDPPEKGAQTPVWLATAPELANVNGKYYVLNTETELTEAAQDQPSAQRLWDFSAELAGF